MPAVCLRSLEVIPHVPIAHFIESLMAQAMGQEEFDALVLEVKKEYECESIEEAINETLEQLEDRGFELEALSVDRRTGRMEAMWQRQAQAAQSTPPAPAATAADVATTRSNANSPGASEADAATTRSAANSPAASA